MRQATVAKKVGISVRQYQNWQAGTHVPDEEHLELLAECFGVTTTYILTGDFLAIEGASLDELPDDARLVLARIEHQVKATHKLIEDWLTQEFAASVREAEREVAPAGRPTRRRTARDPRSP